MCEELFIYEVSKKAYGRGEYTVRRKAKEVSCLECGVKWLMRASRKAPIFCRECSVKGERNPQFGQKPWNKGLKNFDSKEYKRNYVNTLRWQVKKDLIKHMGNKCAMCGLENLPICVWQWHHKDPKQKVKALSQMLIGKKQDLYEESEKCVLLCSNCHKIYHYGSERLI